MMQSVKLKADELRKIERDKAFKSRIEVQTYLNDKLKHDIQRGVEPQCEKDSAGWITSYKVDSLKRLLDKGEITEEHYTLGNRYYHSVQMMHKTKGSSMEIISGSGGGSAEAYFAARADAAKFIQLAQDCCSTVLERQALDRVCGHNESIRSMCKGAREFDRIISRLVCVLDKLARELKRS